MVAPRISPKIILVGFALFAIISASLAFPSGLNCPDPKPYPKFFLDSLWSGPNGYLGTTLIQGYVMVDTTGEFDFAKVASINGTFLQYYSKVIGTYVMEMYINLFGQQVKVMEAPFSLLERNPFNRFGEFCMVSDPKSAMPGYVEGLPITDKFFYNTYYNDTRGKSFGNIEQSEYFFFDETRNHSINCLTTFNSDATIKTFTCYKFQKVSNNVIPPTSKRSIVDMNSLRIGGLDLPEELVAPKYRHYFK